MTLSTGTKLSHYEITSQIGKGGMGEVYQATDTKLGRDVAIKVLPEEFAKDADRVARFQREAKLLASLNHPNIASIYGIEESTGTHFLVMELVEGQTLDERIKSGSIPVEEALKLALQIAEALEAAHEKGVIHRDLKPANIKVTPDGKVKVLDFGLAKAFAGEQADLNLSNSPTLSVAGTQQGVILGTAAYMSPEQARGKEVDKRADIWAFGVVLFEMLTGKQIFSEDTVSDTLASVLKTDPDWNKLPANLHPRIQLLLKRCLKKEPKNRYHDIADARVDIQEVLDDPIGILIQPAAGMETKFSIRQNLPWIAAVVFLTAIIAGIASWLMKPSPPPEPKQIVRSYYELPEDRQFGDLGPRAIAISPDGTLLVYATPEGIYRHSINTWTAELLSQTEGATNLFFSPDGRWIGFISPDGKLKKIAASGGAAVSLASLDVTGGVCWTEDNRILAAGGPTMQWIPADKGGEWQLLFRDEKAMLGSPQLLPDGETILHSRTETSTSKIMVTSLKNKKSRELFDGSFARYLKTGHIIYGWENDLYAVPFDLNALEKTGEPKLLVKDILNTVYSWQYAFSDSGLLAYISGTRNANQYSLFNTPVWVDFDGKTEALPIEPGWYNFPKISPDGTKIAFTLGGAMASKIWIYDLDRRGDLRPFTPDSMGASPLWTTDGRQIAFVSNISEPRKIYLKAANGTGSAEPLGSDYGRSVTDPFPSSWSKDGKELIFAGFGFFDGSITYDIGMLSMEGDGSYRPLLQEKFIETEPKLSPDKKWMAYTSDESGWAEVYVRSYPVVDEGERLPVSTNGGHSPLWSLDSRKIYYRNENAVMAVTLKMETDLELGEPEELFRGAYFPQPFSFMPINLNSWDIDAKRNRFLMIKLGQATGGEPTAELPHKVNIITNWFEELKEKVPVD